VRSNPMLIGIVALTGVILPGDVLAQARVRPQQSPPTLEQGRKEMGIPSVGEVRGQKDAVGFASTAAQMAKVFELSSLPPVPEKPGEPPPGPIIGVLCPHDDYLYAGRAYRQVMPLLSARTIVLVGVFHQ
jgi:hypothetical protein